MKDLVCAVAVGKIEGQVAADLSKDEDNVGESDMPIAIAPRNKEFLLMQMDGLLSKEEIDEAIGLAFEACEKIHAIQVDAIKRAYSEPRSEIYLKMGE